MIDTHPKRGRPKIVDPLERQSGVRIYDALQHYRYLTGAQLTKLLYAPNSHTMVMQRLLELRETGRINSDNFIPRTTNTLGPTPLIWSPLPGKKEPGFWGHVMLVNDIMITVERFARDTAGVELLAHALDYELKQHPVPVQLPGGKAALVVPDGFSALRIKGLTAGLVFEADRGNESRNDPYQSTTMQSKLLRLAAVARGAYAEHFRVPRIRIPFVIRSNRKSNEARLRDLLDWTEEILIDDGELVNEVFRFTIADPAVMSPHEFLTGHHWVQPYTRTYVALITL
jgi:hypothetical protein